MYLQLVGLTSESAVQTADRAGNDWHASRHLDGICLLNDRFWQTGQRFDMTMLRHPLADSRAVSSGRV